MWGVTENGLGRRVSYLWLSVMVGLVAVLVLVVAYRHLAVKITLEHETRSNVDLTHMFARAVWSNYEHLVAPGSRIDDATTQSDLVQLRDDVLDHMRNTRIVKVKIYDANGLTVFSTDPSQIGEHKKSNQGVVTALSGEVVSLITRRDSMDTFEGTLADRHIVSTYIPIVHQRSNRPHAVFEVYSDVTNQALVDRSTAYVLIGVLGAVLLLYGLLLVAAERADRAIQVEHGQRLTAEAEIRYQAYHDALTGLPNRRSFREDLDAMLTSAKTRTEGLAVMFLDIDNFKLVNDGFGHSIGDELLQAMARRLRECARSADALYHMSGDEFIIVLCDRDVRNAARIVAERVLTCMSEPISIGGQMVTVSCSIGVSMFPDDGRNRENLLIAADRAMYLAKDSGRNQCRFYKPRAARSAIERLTTESELRRAAESDQFVLHYQPRIDVESGKVAAVEALIRWPHPRSSVVSTRDTITFLERNGLIAVVGRWVVRSACEQVRNWLDSDVGPMRVSINVSPRQFLLPGFAKMTKHVIAEARIPPELIELELTESALLDTSDETSHKLSTLKDLGVLVTIDDFGTGYSSLNYLRSMPIDYLKIDKSFVSGVVEDAKDAAIVSSILSLASKLGVRVVAEGVETAEQLEWLRANGCEEYQGFLFSEAVAPRDVERFIRKPQGVIQSTSSRI